MFRYAATAWALKAFSTSKTSQKAYRDLGNVFGAATRKSSPMPDYYVERVLRMRDLAQRLSVVRNGSKMLELGTGWVHWEALSTRLFYEIEATLFDVWDNRQMGPLKSFLEQLISSLRQQSDVSQLELVKASAISAEVRESETFEDLYQRLNFRYLLEPMGRLTALESESFDLVVSAGVFEHLPRESVADYIQDTFRVLRPGGFAIHSINTIDHLHLYDRSASPKQYLKYSDNAWRLLFENKLQYINRLQRSDWMNIFRHTGFELVEETCSRCNLEELEIAEQYRKIDKLSLETTTWNAVYRRPDSRPQE